MTEMKWRREILLPMALEEQVRRIAALEEVLVADAIIDLIQRGLDDYLAEGDRMAAEQRILDAEREEDAAEAATPKPVDVMAEADQAAADAWARAELGLQKLMHETPDPDDADDLVDDIIRVGDERDPEFEAMIPSKPLVRLKRGHYENQDVYMKGIKGLNWDDRYIVLAEVETIDHYVVMNLSTGKILRGMFHLDRFERVPVDEI